MKTNIQAKQLSLNCFGVNLRRIHWASLALTLILLGFLLPAQGQDPMLTNIKNPMDTNVSVGAAITFRVYATSTNLPMTFQWQHEGTDLPAATNVTLVITNVTVAHAGGYQATVWNASGESTNTRTAILTVDPTFIRINEGPGGSDREGSVGAAWGDYDRDGYPDLFFANVIGGVPTKNAFWHNEGDGTFTKITTNSPALATGYWWYAYWIDYDNDGDLDLHVLAAEAQLDKFYRNDGNGVFTPVTPEIVKTSSWGEACSWSDFDNDGWLDVFIPRNSGKDLFFRGAPGGSFRSMTTNDVGSLVEGWSYAVGATCDYDNDGWQDLVAAPFAWGTPGFKCRLHHNEGDGFFGQITEGALANQTNTFPDTWAGFAAGDYDNDGDFDLMVTGGEDGYRARLYRNDGNGIFTNMAALAGVDRPLNELWPSWADYDNDGDLDLLILCSEYFNPPQRYGNESVLFQNNGDGTFTSVEIGSPLRDGFRKSNYTWVDYDHDGFLDLFLSCGNAVAERNYLYRNNLPATGNTNHWLKVRLVGKASNSMGVGAKVRVTATIRGKVVQQLRDISVPGSTTQEDYLAHFGLGDATQVDLVRIEWPSGNVQELTDVAPDRLLTLTEPTLISPTRPSASLNGSVTLTRTAVAGATYQWQFNGVDLAGETNRTLKLTNIVSNQQGRYSVVVSNASMLATDYVYLHVDTTFSKIIEGPQVTDLGCSMDAEWGDYDGDGLADLWVSRYQLGKSAVYRNKGDGIFERSANLPFGQASNEWGLWADFDNDGRLDLLLHKLTGSTHKVSLYSNNGNGTFTPSPLEVVPNWWNRSVMDYNRDGMLDFYYSAGDVGLNRLYRNNGDRTFTRMTAPAVGPLVSALTWGGVCWGDFDDDGWPDLFVPSFRNSKSLMFRNDGTGRFAAVTNLVTKTAGPAIAGAWGDYDNNGRLDLCVADLWGGRTLVWRNLGSGDFDHPAGTPDLPGNHNFAAWADYDNDGFLDLFLSGGNTANVLFHNNGDGSFTKVITGSIVNERPLGGADTYSALWLDYDNDGFLDLYVVNGNDATSINTANFLYHNNGNGNSWLKVKLVGTASNRDGVGAKVRALATYAGQSRWQRRDITGGDLHNGNQLYAHFGLANATKVTTLRIEWPSGTVQEYTNVATNQFLTLWEPPTLSAAVREDGACELSITAEPNRGWQIQASSDLLTWRTLTTLTSTTATMYFIDTAAAGMNYRFYRVESK